MKFLPLTSLLVLGLLGAVIAADRSPVPPASVDERALIEAAFRLDVAKVRILVGRGINVNARYGDHDGNDVFKDPWTLGWPVAANCWTPLIAVASSNRFPPPPRPISIKDLDWAREEMAKTPKEKLGERNTARLEIAKILIDAGAALDADDGYGATALDTAVYSDFESLALFLISRGAKVGTRTGIYIDGDSDITPLHRAIGSPNIVAALIHAGASVNAQNSSGHSPLHWAALEKDVASVMLLLKAGADPNVKDTEGRTPIDWVGRSKHASPAENTIYRLLSAPDNEKHNKPEQSTR